MPSQLRVPGCESGLFPSLFSLHLGSVLTTSKKEEVKSKISLPPTPWRSPQTQQGSSSTSMAEPTQTQQCLEGH